MSSIIEVHPAPDWNESMRKPDASQQWPEINEEALDLQKEKLKKEIAEQESRDWKNEPSPDEILQWLEDLETGPFKWPFKWPNGEPIWPMKVVWGNNISSPTTSPWEDSADGGHETNPWKDNWNIYYEDNNPWGF